MKNLVQFIQEAKNDDANKYYVKINDLENDKKYWVASFSDENNEFEPTEVIFKKKGKYFTFANPDDDRDQFGWHELVSSAGDDKKTPHVAIFKNEKEAKNFCKHYNDTCNSNCKNMKKKKSIDRDFSVDRQFRKDAMNKSKIIGDEYFSVDI